MNNFGLAFRNMPPVTKNLIAICVIVFVAGLVPQIGNNLMKYCALHFYDASNFNLAQLVTYMFRHGNFPHIFFNMFTLFMFGITLEYVMGSRRFLTYYMVCGIGAAVIQQIVWALTLPDMITQELALLNRMPFEQMANIMALDSSILARNLEMFSTVGASGAVYGVLLAFGMLFPNRPLYLMFLPVPIKAKWMVFIWGGMELLLGMSSASDGIAHFAHLGGMIFGFILMIYWKKKGIVRGDFY